VSNVACMKNCEIEIGLASALPDFARGAHGNLSEQQRRVGASAPANAVVAPAGSDRVAPPQSKASIASVMELAKKSNCTACHQLDTRTVGPALRDVAAKYKYDNGAEARLAEKVKKGGSGVWGSIPMPANAVRDEDIRTLVRWILSGAPEK